MLRFSGAGVSDVGRVRPHNEDSGFVGPYVALVADGVGGAAAGEVASATAAYSASAVALGRLRSPARAGARRGLHRRGRGRADGRAARPRPAGDGDHAHDAGHRRPPASRSVTSATRAATSLPRAACCARSPRTTPTSSTSSTAASSTPPRRATHPWRNVVLRSVDGDPEGGGLDVVRLDVPGRRPADAVQRRAHRPGPRRPDRRGAGHPRARRRRGRPHRAGPRGRRSRQHHRASWSTWSTARGWSVTARLLGALCDPRNVVDPAAVHLRVASPPTGVPPHLRHDCSTGVTTSSVRPSRAPSRSATAAGSASPSTARPAAPRSSGCTAPPARAARSRSRPAGTPTSTACASSAWTGPGIGSSTPHLYDRIGDWTGDLELLLDALAIDTCRLIGLSGRRALRARRRAPTCPSGCTASASSAGSCPTRGPDADRRRRRSSSRSGSRRCSRSRGCRSGVAITQGIRLVRPLAGTALDLYAAVQPPGDKNLLSRPGVQGDVPRRPAQRQPLPDLGAAQRPAAVHPRLGLRRRRRRASRCAGGTATTTTSSRSATAGTSSPGCPTRPSPRSTARATSAGSASPRR